MILEVCNDSFFFWFSHTKYLNILCYFVIFFCILLCLIIKNKSLFNIKRNLMGVKVSLFIASVMFLLFLLLIFINVINSEKYEGCFCKVNSKILDSSDNFNVSNDLMANSSHLSLNFKDDRIIIVGDSRMEYIEDDRNFLNIPINFSFIAKSGATISWFEGTALGELQEKLDNQDNNYTYHVVFNMGVNDLNFVSYAGDRATEYFNDYKTLALKYPNVNFYMLSVNPIFDNIDKYFKTNKRTDDKINSFNNTINNLTYLNKLDNMYTCDSYHKVAFNSPDGLHYDLDTDQRILNYIARKCVKFE